LVCVRFLSSKALCVGPQPQPLHARSLWSDDVHAHYVCRRYTEFTASMLTLNADYGDPQIDHILERLRLAACDLLERLAALHSQPAQQSVFLINNYDMVLTVLKEAGVGGEGIPDRCNTARVFDELLTAQVRLSHIYSRTNPTHMTPTSFSVGFVSCCVAERRKGGVSLGSLRGAEWPFAVQMGSVLNLATAQMNHKLAHTAASPHGGFPSAFNRGSPIETISRAHTRTVRGAPKGHSLRGLLRRTLSGRGRHTYAQVQAFVEQQLARHFAAFVAFVKAAEAAQGTAAAAAAASKGAVNLVEAKSLMRDFRCVCGCCV